MGYRVAAKELTRSIESFFFREKGVFFEFQARIICQLKSGHKILVFGNGGSAAQAQHFASELVNRFLKERPPICAIALTTDTSSLTSISNDTCFDFVFSRQVEALGKEGDIALGISTSGNSRNVIEAIRVAKRKGMITAAFTGEGGGKLSLEADYVIKVPSRKTPRIQEVHLFLIHLLAQEIEKKMFS